MNKIITISDLQTQAKKCVDYVKTTDEAIVITQKGRPVAVLLSYDDFAGLEATRDEMSYPDWQKRLQRAERESHAGKGRSLEASLTDRRPCPKS